MLGKLNMRVYGFHGLYQLFHYFSMRSHQLEGFRFLLTFGRACPLMQVSLQTPCTPYVASRSQAPESYNPSIGNPTGILGRVMLVYREGQIGSMPTMASLRLVDGSPQAGFRNSVKPQWQC